jgi:hypothetical protein
MGVRGRMVVAVAIFALMIAAIILLPYIQAFLSLFFQQTVPSYSDYQFRREMVVSANGGLVNNVTIDSPAPADLNVTGEVQTITDVAYQPMPGTVTKDGQSWLVWEGGAFDGSSTFEVQMTISFHAEAKVWDISSSESLNVSDIPSTLRDRYDADEWKIVVNDSAIMAAAHDIVGGEQNVEVALKDIYDWMQANVRYPTTARGDPATSVETLSSKVGDCDDQAILFCALARACGIPAWMQLGALYDGSANVWGGHAWVQTYIPLRAGGGQYVIIDTVNHHFLAYTPDKYVEYTDDGQAAHLHDYYYSFSCFYDEATYPPGEAPSFTENFVPLYHYDSSQRIVLDANSMTIAIAGAITRRDTVQA